MINDRPWKVADQASPREALSWEIRRRAGMQMSSPIHRGVFEVTGLITHCGRTLQPKGRFEVRPAITGAPPSRACQRCWPVTG